MKNYEKFEKKVKNAKGKTKELRLSISEAEGVVASVTELSDDNSRMRKKIEELEQALTEKVTGTINVSGSKF